MLLVRRREVIPKPQVPTASQVAHKHQSSDLEGREILTVNHRLQFCVLEMVKGEPKSTCVVFCILDNNVQCLHPVSRLQALSHPLDWGRRSQRFNRLAEPVRGGIVEGRGHVLVQAG
jgi:hypothetical protein